MAWQDLTRRIPMSRAEVGAHDAFLLDRHEEFYVVESGYVDLFAAVVDDERRTLTRAPFIARIPVGSAFFGSLIAPNEGGTFFIYQAVPTRGAVLLRGKREHLASRDAFDMDAVSLIDDWVVAASEFVARYERRPRETLLIEADPDVPYKAHSVVSAHHHEVLWFSAGQQGLLAGRPWFPVAGESLFPLTEHIWLTLPEETRVSAVHTPGAIVTGRLWTALDRYNVQILRCAARYWVQTRRQNLSRLSRNRRQGARTQEAMLRELAGLLVDTPPAVRRRAETGARCRRLPPSSPTRPACGSSIRLPLPTTSTRWRRWTRSWRPRASVPAGSSYPPDGSGGTDRPSWGSSPMRRGRGRWRSSTAVAAPTG